MQLIIELKCKSKNIITYEHTMNKNCVLCAATAQPACAQFPELSPALVNASYHEGEGPRADDEVRYSHVSQEDVGWDPPPPVRENYTRDKEVT